MPKPINYDYRSKRIVNSVKRVLSNGCMKHLTKGAYEFIHTYMQFTAHTDYRQFIGFYSKSSIYNNWTGTYSKRTVRDFATRLASEVHPNQYPNYLLAVKHISKYLEDTTDDKSYFIGHTMVDLIRVAKEYLKKEQPRQLEFSF